jgi:hypothetical protein
MHQFLCRGWNLENQNGFDAIGEQLDLFEGQKTCGQRHNSPSMRVRSGNLVRNVADSKVPKRTCKLQGSTRHHTTPLSAISLITRNAMCKYFFIAGDTTSRPAHSPWSTTRAAVVIVGAGVSPGVGEKAEDEKSSQASWSSTAS